MWPRTAKLYCHREGVWPAEPDIVERIPTRACTRRGAAIDLVLDRRRESRSQFVLTRIRGGREAIFWQSARTTKQARPRVSLPTARAQGVTELVILVDSHERYPCANRPAASTRAAEIRTWAREHGYAVSDRGRIAADVRRVYERDHPGPG